MNTIEQLEVSGSHWEVGRNIGQHFAGAIHRLFDNYGFLQELLLPFLKKPTGQGLFQSYLKLHRKCFPQYISELEGMAEGAERPFEEIFAVNLRGEFAGLIVPEQQTKRAANSGGQGCTDCLVLIPEAALIGHNEDGPPAGSGNMFVVRVTVDGYPTFNALCYPGFLAGNAFGFNEFGILHSINNVAPRPVKAGVARHFIARSLLEARSLEEAVWRVSIPGRAAGFNYNIGSLAERRIVSVEVAPGRHHVREVQGFYTHTNHYFELNDQEQEITLSSRKRLERCLTVCRAKPPTHAGHVVALLGDQTDRQFPIYRDATLPDEDATLCSALYDLDRRVLRIYWDHPVKEPEKSMKLAL